jgi:tetratricopeptide (TPR) repeat protein
MVTLKEHLEQAQQLNQAGNAEQAIAKYEEILQIKSNCLPALKQLADILMKQGRIQEAIVNYQKAITLKPDLGRVYQKLGFALKQNGQLDEAITAYEQELELSNDPSYIYRKLAQIYSQIADKKYKNGQFDEALATYQKAIIIPQVPVKVYQGLTDAVAKKGLLSDAIKVYLECSKLEKTHDLTADKLEALYFRLGEIVLHLGIKQAQLDQVVNCFQEASDNQPDNAWNYNNLATVLARQGKTNQAEKYYRQAIALQPENWQAHLGLSRLLLKKGQKDQVFEFGLKALQINPMHHKIHQVLTSWFNRFKNELTLAEIEKRIKSYLDVIDSVAPFQENLDLLLSHVGKTIKNTGSISEAIKYNQKAILHKIQKSKPEFVSQYWEQGKLKGPDFLIIGVMKCGTTALYDYMIQHPQILPALEKEPNRRGLAQKREKLEQNMEYYLSLFPPLPEESKFVTGEASTLYIYFPGVEQTVFDYFPNTKLIVILRNPVKRVISQYFHWLRLGQEKLSLEEVINREIKEFERITEPTQISERPNNRDYVIPGLYVYYLEKWMKLFPREQFLILRNEDLAKNPATVMKQVFESLGLPDYQQIHYPPRNKGTYSEQVDEGLLSRLKDFYRPHNQRLEEFLGMKFDWD